MTGGIEQPDRLDIRDRGTHLLEALVEFGLLQPHAVGRAPPCDLVDAIDRNGDRLKYGLRVPGCDVERSRDVLVGCGESGLVVDPRHIGEQRRGQRRARDQDQAQGPQSSVALGLHDPS